LRKLAEVSVSIPLIHEMTAWIGQELEQHVQQQAREHAQQTLQPAHAEPPRVAAIGVDAGRMMTRALAGRAYMTQRGRKRRMPAC
jgi:hypothetical protein